ncbi:MAG TPA: DUF1998 domain-containing protein [Chloroflexus aurantiacus]|jgi:hypothetical protein|uniref:MrfA-like Zn-binding domain-containing protein n=1 Tax=Chloroflexus aurantiacus (strain ATCC 29366 / DSM 635 / J-10-fl) TaxID=324602 RepID=A9WFD3_CHLAA|nr:MULTISPECIES: DUF1998 domain-containing protein [Chloroflexus]ABY36117.1 conserved hypothetical protein [Chloroflexus aurantiacus J-10-fl]GIV91335.1 MAG: hypothetical protein KatS3mg056_0044 [Chloroflexus sp.]HBW66433.1 DUF1998 domain-containing protein [Chloroflexus aurantiacus]
MPQIRRSQFLTTYGPGAILEGINGPRIILSTELSDVFSDIDNPTRFEITDQRLSQGLLGGAGILRLPSNAELGKPETKALYKTKRFPAWSLCPIHNILYRKTQDDDRICPRCPRAKNKWEAWRIASRQAIRFVRACPAGHLDDVDWIGIITHTQENCSPSFLLWHGSGALKNITVECPDCKGKINLGVAYSQPWPCSGRFPEKEPEGGGAFRPGCQYESRIIQRGAANLRIPEIVSALVIPRCDTSLHRLLQISDIYAIVLMHETRPFGSKQEFIRTLESLVNRQKLEPEILRQIESYSEEEIFSAIGDILGLAISKTPYEFRRDEFHALLQAAERGHPPAPPKRPGEVPNFEVQLSQVRRNVVWNRLHFRVTPVSRLRVVMVQRGYRRIPAGQSAGAQTVDTVFELSSTPGRRWYIGAELSGEGIFIDLDLKTKPYNMPALNDDDGCVAQLWWQAWQNPDEYLGNSLLAGDSHQLHPTFVWWHTLAHRLINALSVDSGYSSAAIRERIFLDVDERTGQANGGILLYTAQPGGDGTLGGLIALVPEFERVLERALRTLDICSNDPLCGEERFGRDRYNGAACYACSLVSETSCEHRNMSLDRKLLLEGLQ